MSETVYRVQDVDGIGPWKPGLSKIWVQDRDDHKNLLPWFIEFDERVILRKIELHKTKNIGCGCGDIEQLRRWFSQIEYFRLLLLGYRAVKMQADVIFDKSNIQLIFGKNKRFNDEFELINLY